MSRAVSWLLPLVTLAVYAWLVLGPGRELGALAGGLPPPDLRAMGYDLAAIRAWLEALPPEGVALYLGPVARLDTAFPLLMGLTLLWWMRPLAGPLALVGAALALAYVGLDLAENRAVAGLIRTGPEGLDAGAVAWASALTRAKFAAFALALGLALWRRRRRPGAQAGGRAQA